ncbi:MAG: aspartate kinase, partial [Bacteroidetes bacterium CG_4_10_14_3_um_filter_42_6]
MMRVFKFGGALMKDAAGINRVVSLMEEYGCEPLVVVVSAVGKTTNALEELIRLKNQNNIPVLHQEFFNLK